MNRIFGKKRQDSELRIIIAGGGTGGHLFPGIAVAREIQSRYRNAGILFVIGRKTNGDGDSVSLSISDGIH